MHDIGHGPFSHPSETVLSEIAGDPKNIGSADKIHEVITRQIIRSDPGLAPLISERDREDIIKLLDVGLDQRIFKDIVSGPLDADKQDYLLRDSHHCGVRYGIYDLGRLHDVLRTVSDESGDSLAVEADGINTLEQFVLARYYLTTQVIVHKGRRISDAMLVRALLLGVQVDRIGFLQQLYTYEPDRVFVAEYVRWNDERLMSTLLEPDHENTWAGRMMRRLADRRLLKIVFRRPVAEFPDLVLDSESVRTIAPEVERAVSEALHVAPELVIFNVHRSPPTRKSEGKVLLAGTDGRYESFETKSMVFKKVDESLREAHLECFGPLDGLDEQGRRTALADVAKIIDERVGSLNASKETGENHAH